MEINLKNIQKQANKDPRVKSATRSLILLSVSSFFVFGIIGNLLVTSGAFIYGSFVSMICTLILIVVPAVKLIKVQRVVRREIAEKWVSEEEARLLKIKESMTPAEWETYKLQMENNKLLKDLKRRGSTTRTTTTYGFTEEL